MKKVYWIKNPGITAREVYFDARNTDARYTTGSTLTDP